MSNDLRTDCEKRAPLERNKWALIPFICPISRFRLTVISRELFDPGNA
jgi:hypothetical protein